MKKSIPQYIVDAFAERTFEGNPAAVCGRGVYEMRRTGFSKPGRRERSLQ